MWLLGDGGDSYAGLTQGGDNLEQRNFLALQAAAEHANHGMALGQRRERSLDRGGKTGNFAKTRGRRQFGVIAIHFFRNMGQCFLDGSSRCIRLGNHGVQEANFVAADVQEVAIEQWLLLDGSAIDISAIGTAQVFDADFAISENDHGMLAADGQIFDHDVVVGAATQGRALLGELHFLDNSTID